MAKTTMVVREPVVGGIVTRHSSRKMIGVEEMIGEQMVKE